MSDSVAVVKSAIQKDILFVDWYFFAVSIRNKITWRHANILFDEVGIIRFKHVLWCIRQTEASVVLKQQSEWVTVANDERWKSWWIVVEIDVDLGVVFEVLRYQQRQVHDVSQKNKRQKENPDTCE